MIKTQQRELPAIASSTAGASFATATTLLGSTLGGMTGTIIGAAFGVAGITAGLIGTIIILRNKDSDSSDLETMTP